MFLLQLFNPKFCRKLLDELMLLLVRYVQMIKEHHVVSDQMVSQMKDGSVILMQVLIKEMFLKLQLTNHAKPTYNKYGVVHYCVPNIPSRVARTASYSLSNLLTPIILKAGDFGGLNNVIVSDVGLRQGVYICHGMLTNKMVAEWFNLDYKEIDLIIASI